MENSFTTDELEGWFAAIIASMRERGIEEIDLDRGYYYCLDSLEVWKINSDPPKPTLGDVFDDLVDLSKDCSMPAEERGAYLWHTINHLKGPLTLLAARFASSSLGKI